MPRRLAVILTAAAATLVPASLAAAHEVEFGRSVNAAFHPKGDPQKTHTRGKVSSPKRKCKVDSRVILFMVEKGPDDRIGSDRTDNLGRFRIDAPGGQFEAGRYYLVVKRKVLSKRGEHRHICPKLKTNTVELVG